LRRLTLVVLGVLLLGGFVVAQSSDRVEVFGGYTYMTPDFTLVSPHGVNGWNASANFKARQWIGFVADFSGFYPSYTYPQTVPSVSVSGKAYTFLFGPQVSLPRGRFAPFARFLIGDSHVTPQTVEGTSQNFFRSNNAVSLAAGGGLDYSVTRRVAIRGQADWLYAKLTPLGGGDPGVNYVKNRNVVRISTGVVFRF
jgi:opacity protein-like surface antigen